MFTCILASVSPIFMANSSLKQKQNYCLCHAGKVILHVHKNYIVSKGKRRNSDRQKIERRWRVRLIGGPFLLSLSAGPTNCRHTGISVGCSQLLYLRLRNLDMTSSFGTRKALLEGRPVALNIRNRVVYRLRNAEKKVITGL